MLTTAHEVARASLVELLAAPPAAPAPVEVPFDPADADRIPPADLDTCDHCMGDGVIAAWSEGQPIDVDCNRCHGFGDLRGAA